MADDAFQQLVPQKRSLDQGELSTHLESKAQWFSGHAKEFSCSESFFNCQSTAVQEDVSGVSEARWSSATGIGSIPGINESEAIGNDKPESEDQAYQELSSPGPAEVCYGCIPDVSVEFRKSLPDRSDSASSSDHPYILEVLPGPDYFVICASSADEMIGFINLKASCTLKDLQRVGEIRLEIALDSSEWGVLQQSFMRPFTRTVEVTVFGMPSIAEAVGKCLSAGDLFLQSPLYDTGVQYQNPHLLIFSDVSECESESEGCRTSNVSIENTPTSGVTSLTKGLFNVMNDLDQHEQLCPVNVDPRLTVELLRHQRAGVDFMVHRETGKFQPSKSLWCKEAGTSAGPCYRHVITGSKMPEPLAGPFGGILADEMGLGKTVTTLATILSTLGDATTWLLSKPSGSSMRQRSKATVIVVPSEVLMNQWFDEIQTRIIPGTVLACKYHGQARESQNETIQHIDIMLTTYATAMSELRRRKGLLHRTEFYRLVLDEAHNVRRRHTRQYAAVSEISATRRWCLTGTPIQNKVDDLGALVSFLRVPLLDDPEVFRVHVTNQTYSNVLNRFDNLRTLLRCICLRRTKAIGYLDDPTVDLLYLDFSPAEAQSYNEILRHHRAMLEMAVSLEDNANASQQIFKAFHELRLFCSNGTREAKERSCIEFETIEENRDIKVWPQDDKAEHTSCGRKIHDPCGTNGQNSSRFTEESSDTQPTSKITLTNGLDRETIHSTMWPRKLCGLLKRILEQPPDEKCIVFSFWKASLDLVGTMLQHHDIAYLRIDGSVSGAERQRALRGFDSVSERIVLLMTIGTGAVGLNLTSATRVHILEPQWNPMVEQQAIGRALRLGQTKKVVVSRYIMKGTIEEHVLSSQDYKLQVALKSFETHRADGSVVEKAKLFNQIIPEL